MQGPELLPTLTACLAAALVLGYAMVRIGLSPIVGYLLAGVAVGPHTPGFNANHEIAEQSAEVGVILLMFGVGMHFHLKELWAVRRVALTGALVQSLVATLLGAILTHYFHWSWGAGVVFGLAISVASTVVLVRVLTEHRDLHTPTGHIAVGWLVVEDLFTVLVLVLLPTFYQSNPGGGHILAQIGIVILKIVLLTGAVFIIGSRVMPWLLERVAETRSRELFTLSVLAIALGVALVSAKLFGVSMALGAFLAGMVVGRSEFSLRAAADALPMRDAFAVLFFVSIGMLLDPSAIFKDPGLFLGTILIIMVGKPLTAFAIIRLLRYPLKVSLGVAAALAQIGEFSFMLALLGIQLNVLPPVAMNVIVTGAIVSITLNSLVYRLPPLLHRWWARRSRKPTETEERSEDASSPPEASSSRYRSVVVGFGPVGQTVVRILRENGITPTVVELNLETVRRLREQGLEAVYGDASQLSTLESAGLHRVGSLVLTAAGHEGSAEIIRQARDLNPRIQILARSNFLHEMPDIHRAGAEDVFSGEGETALALTEAILRKLGASPEQIDRERARVHRELLHRGR